MTFKYQYLAVGGTFDHLHLGHKSLIDMAFKLSHNVSIGVVKDHVNKILAETIETYEVRENVLKKYLKSKDYLSRATISPIKGIYGSTLEDTNLQALLVTKNTYSNGLKINNKRKEAGLKLLKIVCAPLIKGDDNKIISSERIRLGEIDREGQSFLKLISKKKEWILPIALRDELRKPLGKIIKGNDKILKETAIKVDEEIKKLNPTLTISIGDIISLSLQKIGLDPDIQVIDYKNKRVKIAAENVTYHVTNEAGTINRETALIFKRNLNNFLLTHKKQQIIISGEEDLTALIAILLAPINSIVVYGQFGLGVIIVKVTEKEKKIVKKLILKFY